MLLHRNRCENEKRVYFIISIIILGVCVVQWVLNSGEKNVVFLQSIDPYCYESGLPIENGASSMHHNTILYGSQYDFSDKSNTMYAFMVKLRRYHEDELPEGYPVQKEHEEEDVYKQRCLAFEISRMKNVLLDEGMYIVEDYVFVEDDYHFVVATTMENLLRVFSEQVFIAGWSCRIEPAPRPDLLEIVSDYGYTKDYEEGWDKWYRNCKEYRESLEDKEAYVTLKVSVTSP